MPNSKYKFPDSLAERFTKAQYIESGAVGSVFRVHDKILQKDVAIKLLPQSASEAQIIRFQQEAKATSKLNHQNIVQIFNFDANDSGDVFMVFELIQGESLKNFIESQKHIDTKFSISIFQQICSGMDHAHEHNILHRDLKPANILLFQDQSSNYIVKIIDFGIAKVLDVGVELTTGNIAVGTPAYMSPEQGNGEPVDQRADIYSFGCIMYEFLTGQKLFEADTPLEVLYKHSKEEIPLLSKTFEDDPIPEHLAKVVYKCLSKKKEDRYSNFQEVDEALENALHAIEEESIQPDKDEASVPPHSADKENKPFMLLIVVGAILTTGALAAIFLSPPIDSNHEPKKETVKLKVPEGERIPLTKIPELDPKFEKSSNPKLAKKARSHMRDQNYEQAIPFLSKIIERYKSGDDLKGKHLEIFSKRVECYVQNSYYDLAKKDIEWLKEHDQSKTYYYLAAGDYEFFKKEYSKAIKHYGKVLENDPDQFRARYQRMESFYQEKKYREAINDAHLLLKQKRYRTQTLRRRAKCYLALDNKARALRDYNRLLKNHQKKDMKRATLLYERALVFEKLEKPYEVIDDTTNALAINPENSRFYELRSRAYKEIGDSKKAKADIANIEK